MAGEAEVRKSPWLNSGKRPKAAQNGPEWPTRSTHFLSGQRPIFGPPGRHPTHFSDTKRPQMAQNGAEIKKIPIFEGLEGSGNPLAGPRFKPFNRQKSSRSRGTWGGRSPGQRQYATGKTSRSHAVGNLAPSKRALCRCTTAERLLSESKCDCPFGLAAFPNGWFGHWIHRGRHPGLPWYRPQDRLYRNAARHQRPRLTHGVIV